MIESVTLGLCGVATTWLIARAWTLARRLELEAAKEARGAREERLQAVEARLTELDRALQETHNKVNGITMRIKGR